MPFIADKVFHQGAAGLGYLYAAAGAGALVATFVVSGYGSKYASSVFINGGIILFAIAMIFFSFTSNIWIAYLTLFFGGFGLLSAFSIINARIQHLVEPQFRGRVLSIYLLMFVGLFPIGNLQIGFMSEQFGPQVAIRVGSIIVLIAAIIGYLMKGKIISSHAEYLTKLEIEAGTQEVIRDTRKS
jgi:MFS family permease